MEGFQARVSRLASDTTRLTVIGWTLFHLFLPLGAVVVYTIGRPRIVGLFLYVVLATVLVDGYIGLRRFGTADLGLPPIVTNPRLPVLGYLLSMFVFLTVGRGLVFYAGLAATVTLVVVGVLTADERVARRRRWVYIGTAMAVSTTAVLTEVLGTAYYANVSDTIWHTSFIEVVASYGEIGAIEVARYARLPGYHALGASVMELTGLPGRTVGALVVVVVYQMALLLIYGVTRQYVFRDRIALTAVALAAVNASFLFRAAKSHAQELSFGFFCLWFFLFVRRFEDDRYLIPAALVGLAWLVTHHLSVAMGVSILSLLVFERLLRVVRSMDIELAETRLFLFGSFVAALITYWVVITPLFLEVLSWSFGYSPAARGETSNLLIESYHDVPTLLTEAAPHLVDYLYFAPLLGLVLVAGHAVFLDDRFQLARYAPGVLVFGFAAMMYFPNPAWIPLESFAVPLRWATVVYFVVAPLVGLGLVRMYDGVDVSSRSLVTLTFVFLLVFTNVAAGQADPSLVNLAGYDKQPKAYISDSELDAIDFAQVNSLENQTIWAPSFMDTYIQYYPPDPVRFVEGRVRKVELLIPERRVVSGAGLTVVPTETYTRNSIQVRAIGFECDEGTTEIGLAVARDETSRWDYPDESIVYTDGRTLVTYSERTTTDRIASYRDCSVPSPEASAT